MEKANITRRIGFEYFKPLEKQMGIRKALNIINTVNHQYSKIN
jgi:hypothetical protein